MSHALENSNHRDHEYISFFWLLLLHYILLFKGFLNEFLVCSRQFSLQVEIPRVRERERERERERVFTGALSALRQFLATETHLKMMKNILPQKLFLFSRYLNFYLEFLVMQQNSLIWKIRLISNFIPSQPC